MVEDRKEIQGGEQADEEISTGRKIAAFLLTLIVLPFLFAGTCFPIVSIFDKPNSAIRTLGFGAYCVGFLALLAFVAVRTKNPGIRWGIIIVGSIIAVLMCIFLPTMLHGF